MKKDDQEILKEVQKNSGMAISAIDTISEKVQNDELLHELSKERLLYSVIQNKATDRLQSERAEGYNGREESLPPAVPGAPRPVPQLLPPQGPGGLHFPHPPLHKS